MTVITTTVDRNVALATQITGELKRRTLRWHGLYQALAGIDWLTRGMFHVWRHRRYLTPIKIANIAMINHQFKLKTQRVIGRPYKMKIE